MGAVLDKIEKLLNCDDPSTPSTPNLSPSETDTTAECTIVEIPPEADNKQDMNILLEEGHLHAISGQCDGLEHPHKAATTGMTYDSLPGQNQPLGLQAEAMSYMEQWQIKSNTDTYKALKRACLHAFCMKINAVPVFDIHDTSFDAVDVVLDKIEYSLKNSPYKCTVCYDKTTMKNGNMKKHREGRWQRQLQTEKQQQCPHSDTDSRDYWLLPAFDVNWCHEEIQQYAMHLRQGLHTVVDNIPRDTANKHKWLVLFTELQARCQKFNDFRKYHFLILSRRYKTRMYQLDPNISRSVVDIVNDTQFRFTKSQWHGTNLTIGNHGATTTWRINMRRSRKFRLRQFMNQYAMKRNRWTMKVKHIRQATVNHFRQIKDADADDLDMIKSIVLLTNHVHFIQPRTRIIKRWDPQEFIELVRERMKAMHEADDKEIYENEDNKERNVLINNCNEAIKNYNEDKRTDDDIPHMVQSSSMSVFENSNTCTNKQVDINSVLVSSINREKPSQTVKTGRKKKTVLSSTASNIWSKMPPVVQKLDTVNKFLAISLKKLLSVCYENINTMKSLKCDYGRKDKDVAERLITMKNLVKRLQHILADCQVYVNRVHDDVDDEPGKHLSQKYQVEIAVQQLLQENTVFSQQLEVFCQLAKVNKQTNGVSYESHTVDELVNKNRGERKDRYFNVPIYYRAAINSDSGQKVDALAAYVHGHYDDFSLQRGDKGKKGPKHVELQIKEKRRRSKSSSAPVEEVNLVKLTKRQRKQMLKGKVKHVSKEI